MAQLRLIKTSIKIRCVNVWNCIKWIPKGLAKWMLAITGREAQQSTMYHGSASTCSTHPANGASRAITLHPIILCFVGIAGLQPVLVVVAAERCVAPAATRVVSVQGNVTWSLVGSTSLTPAKLNDLLCIGDTVRVGTKSRAVLRLPNETTIPLDQNTVFQLKEAISDKEPTLIELIQGAIHVITRTPKPFKVDTPYMNAAVEGTEFYVGVDGQEAKVAVIEGKVNVSNEQGTLLLTDNEAATAKKGQAPQKTLTIKPRDAVQWALYYPPLFDPKARPGGDSLAAADDLYRLGKITEAIVSLDSIPEPSRNADYRSYRAGLLLLVGRADEAEPDIEQALKDNPNNADALSLKAIIAIVRNDKARAVELANQATQIDDKSAAASIALSYALQANFKIEEALRAARLATDKGRNNALAWARVAELELSIPNYDKSKEAAEKAVKLNPNLARTQSILGFANLTRIDIKEAKQSFTKAIELDQADPLPRLGLGLATIREGNLKAGKEQIEIAASLDPENSLIRSYLGKAYYEEKRDEEAGKQFDLAKERDPKDPTPYFYDAIRKQTENRPVEALQDLGDSIERNDFRAPDRSTLLLDEDAAARSANLSKIYSELGFEQLALSDGHVALTWDPGSYLAHRFLSEAYAQLPGHEVARVSELLQAQLRQPLSTNTLPPRLSIADLSAVAAMNTIRASLSENTFVYDNDRWRLLASGLAGNQGTFGDELLFSAVTGSFAYSVSQFHFETNGFRENNDVKDDLYGLQAQYALSPELAIQLEFRRRERDQGDLTANFDPNGFSNFSRRITSEKLGRLGFHFAHSVSSDFVLAVAQVRRDGLVKAGEKSIVEIEDRANQRGTQAEAQYQLRRLKANFIFGMGGYRVQSDERTSGINFLEDPPSTLETTANGRRRQENAYGYANFFHTRDLTSTLGLSYERASDDFLQFRVRRFNPKIGLQWKATPKIKLRAAAMRTLKRALAVDQTVEPTQIAGFNQFFDDLNATKATIYGIGIDARPGSNWYAGFQFSQRDLLSPGTFVSAAGSRTDFQEMRERTARAYLYWTPSSKWALTAELYDERFRRDFDRFPTPEPIKTNTTSLPLSLKYFGPRRLWLKLGVEFVRQYVEIPQFADGPPSTDAPPPGDGPPIDEPPPSDGPPAPDGGPPTEGGEINADRQRETFAIVNAAIGYRLPNRRGVVSLECRNLFKETFRFQDDNFRRAEEASPRYVPGRTIFIRLNFSL